MRARHLTAAALLLLGVATPALAGPCFKRAASGRLEPTGNCTLPSGVTANAVLGCDETTTGGVSCTFRKPPIWTLLDVNGDTLVGDPPVYQLKFGATLELLEEDDSTAIFDVDVLFKPDYSSLELDAMGALTVDQDADIDGDLNLNLGTLTQQGNPFTSGHAIYFDCTSYTLSGTKSYCTLVGGAATVTQANALIYPALACPKLRTMTGVALNTSNVVTAIPASNTVAIGLSVNSVDSGTLCTFAASATNIGACTPATTTSWASGDTVSLWVQRATGSSPAVYNFRLGLGCY